jgi:hypothetical protein
LELATVHHNTSSALQRLLSHKGDVVEAKMRQQARLCASLDVRLKAANTAIDASATEIRSWLQSADCVLQVLARQLSGIAAPGTPLPHSIPNAVLRFPHRSIWWIFHTYRGTSNSH